MGERWIGADLVVGGIGADQVIGGISVDLVFGGIGAHRSESGENCAFSSQFMGSCNYEPSSIYF